jgi:DNA-binding MarR family transcriptional regulator
MLLAQLGTHAAARFAERLEPLGLAPRHAGVLRVLRQSTGVNQRVVAESLGLPPSRLVALVDELEHRGLVERREDPQDRRSYALHLTARGSDVLEEIGRIARRHGEDLLRSLDPRERQELSTFLVRILEARRLRPGVFSQPPGRPPAA